MAEKKETRKEKEQSEHRETATLHETEAPVEQGEQGALEHEKADEELHDSREQAAAGSSREPLRYAPQMQTEVEEMVKGAREHLTPSDDNPVDAATHEDFWNQKVEEAGEDQDALDAVATARLHYYNDQGAL